MYNCGSILFIEWGIEMKEIPMPYIKTNQAGIVLFSLLAIIFQLPILLVILWVIQALGLFLGSKANLFIQLAKPLLKRKIAGAETQANELTRFNNSLGMIFLTLSLICYGLGWTMATYVFAGMLALAALMAICGFCIGCTVYFQYKQFKARRKFNI